MSDLRLSIVVPVKDEEGNLRPLVEACRAGLGELYRRTEIILVDDGSTDQSLARMKELAAEDAGVRWIQFERNCGQSAALDAGFKAARGELVAMIDADMQNDPADLPAMVALLDTGECDCVCGIRQKRMDSWVRRISSKIGNGTRNWLTHETIKDVGCSIRVFRRELVAKVKMFKGMHRFLPTLLRLEGARIKQIPVRHHPRTRGKTKYGIHNRLWSGLRDIFAVRWMQARHVDYRIKAQSGTREAAAMTNDESRMTNGSNTSAE
jgi:glycosyltransferase involved in cell wall biosynthesis